MAIVYSNYASDVINTQHSNIVGQVGAAILPGKRPLLGGGVISVSRFSQKREACRQFLSWLYSDDIASLMVRLGGTSPLVDACSDLGNITLYPWHTAKVESIACGTRGTDAVSISDFSIRRYEFAIGTASQQLSSTIFRRNALQPWRKRYTTISERFKYRLKGAGACPACQTE